MYLYLSIFSFKHLFYEEGDGGGGGIKILSTWNFEYSTLFYTIDWSMKRYADMMRIGFNTEIEVLSDNVL